MKRIEDFLDGAAAMIHARLARGLYPLLLIACAVFMVHALAVVLPNISAMPFGDQFELYVHAAQSSADVFSVGYLFHPHNEHIIATSKLIFFLDIFYFGGTNFFPVLITLTLNAAIAVILAAIATGDLRMRSLATVVTMVMLASGFALVQWENLAWAFQCQFPFALLGALLVIAALTSSARAEKRKRAIAAYIACLALIPFTVFSMGNGIVVIAPLIGVMVAYRLKWWGWMPVLAVYALCLALFVHWTPGPTPIGDPALRTPANLIAFMFAMIGGPFGRPLTLTLSAVMGVVGVAALSRWFVLCVARPWWKREAVNPRDVILIGLAGFCIATAAVTAWGRVPLGLEAALASRYATPMMVFWMIVAAMTLREIIARDWAASRRSAGIAAVLVLATVFVGWRTLHAGFADSIVMMRERADGAVFNVLSGVDQDELLRPLYPHSIEHIRPGLAFLREHRLAVYADSARGYRPPLAAINRDAIASLPLCARSALLPATNLSATVATISGWMMDPLTRRAPNWILAFNKSELIGYTRPLLRIERAQWPAEARRSFRGFQVPLVLDSSKQTQSLNLVAVFDGFDTPTCRLPVDVARTTPMVTPQLAARLQRLDMRVELLDEARAGAISPVMDSALPYPGAEVFGTYVRGDGSQGSVVMVGKTITDTTITDTTAGRACPNIIVPVVRGPGPEGLELVVTYPNGQSDPVRLDHLRPHQWGSIDIDGARMCAGGSGALRIELRDRGTGWGSWAAIATPATRP